MKKINFYIAAMVIALGFSSCNSWLDEDPKYTQNSGVVFSTESNAELALLGCYSYMASTSSYGQHWQEVPIAASGICFAQRNGGDGDQLASLNISPSNGLVSTTWKGMYQAIVECNAFIESMEKSSLSQEVKTKSIGEAKFLRALGYYGLVSLFGDVPLKTIASSSDGIAVSRTPVAEVMAQVIADFKAAIDQLPETSEDGRANSWAAKALLGKTYYKLACLGIDADANYKNAKTMFDEVYNARVYALQPKFGDLFGVYVTGSKESIFQLNFSAESTITFNRGSNRFAPSLSTSGISWGTYSATKLAYDLQEGTYPGDPRVALTYMTKWRTRSGNNQANPKPIVGDVESVNDYSYLYPYITYTNTVGGVTEQIQKNGVNVANKQYATLIPYNELPNPSNPSISFLADYVTNNGDTPLNKAITNMATRFAKPSAANNWPAFNKLYDQNAIGTRSHKNLMVYRYGEMLLEMADVYNELGETSKAISLANEVLTRARNSGSSASAQPANWSTGLTKDQVKEKLYFERIFELSGEPNIYDMIRIKGVDLFKKFLALHNSHEFTAASAAQYATSTNAWSDRLFNNGNLTDDYVKRNLLLPIPSSEIEANSAITDADNNFGY